MKTITIDFELYEKELQEAKKSGFESRQLLVKDLKKLISSLDGHDRDEFYKAMHSIKKLMYELDKEL